MTVALDMSGQRLPGFGQLAIKTPPGSAELVIGVRRTGDEQAGLLFLPARGGKAVPCPLVRSENIPREQLVRDIGQFGVVAVGDDDVAVLLEGGEVAVDL